MHNSISSDEVKSVDVLVTLEMHRRICAAFWPPKTTGDLEACIAAVRELITAAIVAAHSDESYYGKISNVDLDRLRSAIARAMNIQ